MRTSYDVVGGWYPTTLTDLVDCQEDPYITPAGVTPAWALALRAAARDCRQGHPAGIPGDRVHCGAFGCRGAARPGPDRADTDGRW